LADDNRQICEFTLKVSKTAELGKMIGLDTTSQPGS